MEGKTTSHMVSFWQQRAEAAAITPKQKLKYSAEAIKYHEKFPALSLRLIEEALSRFSKFDFNHDQVLDKKEFCQLLKASIPRGYGSGELFGRIAELAFDLMDSDKSGSVTKDEFLASYHDLFCNERRQVALLLKPDFPGLTLSQLEKGLEVLEKMDRNGRSSFGMEEFYQLKEELAPALVDILKKMKADEIFAKIDKEGKGELDAQECLKAYEQFANNMDEFMKPVPPAEGHEPDNTCIEHIGRSSGIPKRVLSPPPRPAQAAAETTPTRPSTTSAQPAATPAPTSTATISPKPAPQVRVTAPAITAEPRKDVNSVFDQFVDSDDVAEILNLFGEIKTAAGIDPDTWGLPVYEAIKAKVCSRKATVLWQLLDTKKKQPDYCNETQEKARVIIVGAGPAGLRTAVEMAFLGARVTLLEKRLQFTRNNLLHVWDSSIRDLRNIGAKFFFGQFAIGGINHIAIRRLQTLLLKVTLLLGVKVLIGYSYGQLTQQQQGYTIDGNKFFWKAKVDASSPVTGPFVTPLVEDDLYCNVLVGADGENSAVARAFDFELKLLQGSRALGITANFVNQQTKEEKNLTEFGLLSVYAQQYFDELNTKHGIDLENLVYYRGETHYFVMTAKMQSLVAKGVCKTACDSASDLLAPTNLCKDKLIDYVREVATYVGMPTHCPFVTNAPTGATDVALFDFSKKHQSTSPFKIVGDKQGGLEKQLLVLLVGDALVEPFWPLGTGCNRAILGAQDAAWTMKGFLGEPSKREAMAVEWAKNYKILSSSSPSDLVPNFALHALNPASRYAKNAVHFH